MNRFIRLAALALLGFVLSSGSATAEPSGSSDLISPDTSSGACSQSVAEVPELLPSPEPTTCYTCMPPSAKLCPQFQDYIASCGQTGCCEYTYAGASCGNGSQPICRSNGDCYSTETCIDGCCVGNNCDSCSVNADCSINEVCSSGCCV